ncbi:MAG: methyl-accepting chemotaxis protein, partial [Thermomicrobium sp.]|nr:methyl-accepting chemotaxis protein [Thermomicrobium sp.]
AELIGGVQQLVERAVQTMAVSARQVEAVSERAGSLRQTFEAFAASAREVEAQSRETLAAAEAIGRESRELKTLMEETAAIAEENSAAAAELAATVGRMRNDVQQVVTLVEGNTAAVEEVSAAAEELAAQANDVSGAANALDRVVDDLAQALARFELESAADGRAPRAASAGASLPVGGNGYRNGALVAVGD